MYSYMRLEVNRRKLTHIVPAIFMAFRCISSKLKRHSSVSPTKIPDRMTRIKMGHVNETKLIASFLDFMFCSGIRRVSICVGQGIESKSRARFQAFEMTMKEKREREEEEAEDDECDYAFCEKDGMYSGWTEGASKREKHWHQAHPTD